MKDRKRVFLSWPFLLTQVIGMWLIPTFVNVSFKFSTGACYEAVTVSIVVVAVLLCSCLIATGGLIASKDTLFAQWMEATNGTYGTVLWGYQYVSGFVFGVFIQDLVLFAVLMCVGDHVSVVPAWCVALFGLIHLYAFFEVYSMVRACIIHGSVRESFRRSNRKS